MKTAVFDKYLHIKYSYLCNFKHNIFCKFLHAFFQNVDLSIFNSIKPLKCTWWSEYLSSWFMLERLHQNPTSLDFLVFFA